MGVRRDRTTGRSDAHHVPANSCPSIQPVYLNQKALHSTQRFCIRGRGGFVVVETTSVLKSAEIPTLFKPRYQEVLPKKDVAKKNGDHNIQR